jgi:Zn-dependent M28 family amino/carboxypeptidase
VESGTIAAWIQRGIEMPKRHASQQAFIVLSVGLLLGVGSGAAAGRESSYRLTRAERLALDTISSRSLEGHLTFIASDLLEGRATPSHGQDIAAAYIAAQFRRAGLEPAGDDGYFQTTDWVPRRRGGPDDSSPPRKVRNVVGVLRGSDKTLAETYVLLTAHYDHLGLKADASATADNGADIDRVFNGANDNGSGVVTVIELAAALSSLPKAPKRSVVFMAYYGEELGLVGARHYAEHPIFPLERTVANINLEQVGRNDDSENPGPGVATVTGFDYSEVGDILRRAGESHGIRVYKHATNSDAFFSRSDNRPLADRGVPAHSFATSFQFPDWHKLGDHADKIDYANMVNISRALARALLAIANTRTEPQWNASQPKADKYRTAWEAARR